MGPILKQGLIMPSQTPGMETTVICTELVFSLHSLALHEFPNDIFTNEDRRQGAVVLHVLCVSTPLVALLETLHGRPGWWGVGSEVPTEASPLPLLHTPGGGPLSPLGWGLISKYTLLKRT